MTPEMQIELPARAENVAIVRHALGALGEAYGVDEETLADIRLAVTEACTNVVMHAYPDGQEGPLEVRAGFGRDILTVKVLDRGPGIVPRPDSPGLGLGLPLIASLAESVELGRDEHDHTEVQMVFEVPRHPVRVQAETQMRGAGHPDDPAAST
jgi:anti-sigma regulatory factor (Ser/Thr protein kinase)